MEYKEEAFDKVPFYMTYPMQNLYEAEMEYEKDLERMKEMYPRQVREILPVIEKRCDELDYEGSRIYDENPDRMMMEEEVARLYQKLKEKGYGDEMAPALTGQEVRSESEPKQKGGRFSLVPPEGFCLPGEEEKELEAMSEERTGDRPETDESRMLVGMSGRECGGWLCSMVGILFQNEVYRRRCRHRRCRRWW